jgi:hypothetical protein
MEMNYRLPEEFVQIGFNLSKFGDKSFALKHADRTIFVFGSDLDFRDDFVGRLCSSYMTMASNAEEVGLIL